MSLPSNDISKYLYLILYASLMFNILCIVGYALTKTADLAKEKTKRFIFLLSLLFFLNSYFTFIPLTLAYYGAGPIFLGIHRFVVKGDVFIILFLTCTMLGYMLGTIGFYMLSKSVLVLFSFYAIFFYRMLLAFKYNLPTGSPHLLQNIPPIPLVEWILYLIKDLMILAVLFLIRHKVQKNNAAMYAIFLWILYISLTHYHIFGLNSQNISALSYGSILLSILGVCLFIILANVFGYRGHLSGPGFDKRIYGCNKYVLLGIVFTHYFDWSTVTYIGAKIIVGDWGSILSRMNQVRETAFSNWLLFCYIVASIILTRYNWRLSGGRRNLCFEDLYSDCRWDAQKKDILFVLSCAVLIYSILHLAILLRQWLP